MFSDKGAGYNIFVSEAKLSVKSDLLWLAERLLIKKLTIRGVRML